MININSFNNRINNNSSRPIYIPVVNKQTFDYDVISYYNQYYASAYVTQYRRIMRNYINNLNTTIKYNKNPFINKNSNKKYNFLYTYSQTYMTVEDNNKIDIYILINNCWRHQNCITDKNNCEILNNIIKNNIVKRDA
jgi:hypothetical protein